MPTREDTAILSAALDRAQLARVASAIAGDGEVVDAAALAGETPDPGALVAALRDAVSPRATVLCAGVLERLSSFVTVVEALVAIAAEREATVVLAVPNQAFAGDAHGTASAWGEGAVSELRGLLPPEHVLWHQVALRGAALVSAGDGASLTAHLEVDARRAVPVTFVLAFGPNAAGLRAAATVVPADLSAELARQRALTAELEVLRARVSEHEAQLAIAAPIDGQAVESPE
jgi:hypothetical protein